MCFGLPLPRLINNLFMSVSNIKFNVKDQPEFFKELRKRVNKHFKENNITRYANLNMKLKTAFMLALYFTPFMLLLTGVITNWWLALLMWGLMGFGMSGLGLSVMHDANHGSYSKNQRVNKLLGGVIVFIGGYSPNWKMQHNVLHHSFTNIDGYDEDLESGVIRLHPHQKRLGIHRFQVFYAPFMYGLMTVYWSMVKDFDQIVRYKKKNLLETQGLTLSKGLTQIIFNKIVYFGVMLALPMLLIYLPWWQTLIGYFMMHYICGLVLAFIFQLAHVVEETDFFDADNDKTVENNWAIHQMKTTANFANGNRLLSWLIGGLNYQVEHHLFPNICHVHYRKISKIVKETASEFKVPYNHHTTFFGALKSHFKLINPLGTGKYDAKVVKS